MAEPASAPQPPIFNLQAYSPAEIKQVVEKIGVKKANFPFLTSVMLAIVAGVGVGFGALYYTIVASDPTWSFASVRVVGGLVFTVGLALVLVGGAELFAGSNLIVMARASGKVSTRTMLRNWTVVWFGNYRARFGASYPDEK
jgi:formate transporter